MRYFATLGYTPNVLDDVRNFLARRPHVTVFVGDPNPEQGAANSVAGAELRKQKVPHTFVEVPQPWDFRSCFEAMADAYREDPDESIVVNASGGTEVMNSAATLFGMLTAAECRYLNRRSGEVHVVDMMRLRLALAAPGSRGAIVQEAARRGGAVPLAVLPGLLGVTAGAVSQQVELLTGLGYGRVEPRQDARGKQYALAEALWPLISVEKCSD